MPFDKMQGPRDYDKTPKPGSLEKISPNQANTVKPDEAALARNSEASKSPGVSKGTEVPRV